MPGTLPAAVIAPYLTALNKIETPSERRNYLQAGRDRRNIDISSGSMSCGQHSSID